MKLLIAEDDAQLGEFLASAVSRLGHEVLLTPSAEDAWENIATFNPHVIITDIHMTGMSGLQLLERIRDSDTLDDMIVIVMTDKENDNDAREALRLRANNFLRKRTLSIELPQILHKYESVSEMLERRREPIAFSIEEVVLKANNQPEGVSRLVDYLLSLVKDVLPPDRSLSVRLGLTELIINAIEHGNLAIGFEEKSKALEDLGSLMAVYQEKLKQPALAARRITVHYRRADYAIQWCIADEGDGFDWRNHNVSPENLLGLNGRGIMLSRLQFDEMIYNDKGNQVTARVKIER